MVTNWWVVINGRYKWVMSNEWWGVKQVMSKIYEWGGWVVNGDQYVYEWYSRLQVHVTLQSRCMGTATRELRTFKVWVGIPERTSVNGKLRMHLLQTKHVLLFCLYSSLWRFCGIFRRELISKYHNWQFSHVAAVWASTPTLIGMETYSADLFQGGSIKICVIFFVLV